MTDDTLGHCPNPDFPGHDQWGYRNESVPAQADIVILGDSHTYGVGVEREEAWPHLLSDSTGATAYSIAFGGWGPGQHLLLMDKALSLRPKLIVEAIYTGNDLWDCFGRFAAAWDGPSPSERLRDWLDPDDTGAQRVLGGKAVQGSEQMRNPPQRLPRLPIERGHRYD